MADRMSAGAVKIFARFSRYASVLAIAFGAMVLTGWTLHIQRLKGLIPGQVAVKANTAICFILLGTALWLATREVRKRVLSLSSTSLALLASFIGLLSLLECWEGWDLGIDQLLFKAGADDLPGSVRLALMSPISAADFFLLGIAIALLNVKGRRARVLQTSAATLAAVSAMFGILDFVLEAQKTHTHIAPLTALVLLLISFAVLCARAEGGLGALLVSGTVGGVLCRRLLPSALLIPIVIAWLRWKGQQTGFYSEWTGLAIMTVSAAVLLGGLTVWTTFVLDRTEARQQESEESVRGLAAIVTCSNDGIIGKTLDGIVTSWNPGAEAIYGYSAEEMIGQPMTRIVPPDRLDEFQEFLLQLRRGKVVRVYETERMRKDGKRIPVSITVSPLRDEAGSIIGASTIARDITDRKQAEKKLQEASRYTRSLIEASLDPLVTISKEGKITDVNEATEKSTGISRDRLIGSDFCDYFTEPDKARQGYQQVFSSGFVRDYPLAIRHSSGQVIDVLYNATVFRNESGEVEGVFAAARDITERKRAQEALLNSEKRYRSLVTATAQVVWTTDPQGVVEDMPMWREITGQTRDEVRGTGWLNAVHPEDRDRTNKVWATAVRDRSLYEIEYRVRRNDGEYRHFGVRGVPVLQEDGSITEWVGTCTDITERKQAEEEVRRLNSELEQRVIQRTAQLEAANRELEAFTYSVSHDLRAPLRHISGFSKMLAEEFAATLPPEAQHQVQRIQEGTRRMGQLVDDLLNLGRVGRREPTLQVAGLRSIVDEVINSLKAEIADRQVEWKIGDLPYVECDTALIQQVFQNLLSNALKFTRPRSHAVIEIGQEQRDGKSVVYVRDNGVGFSMKYADKLFGVFQRLHRAEDFEGTGVGLATVQRIIQKHGGRIWAEAELDKGAHFYFTLGSAERSGEKTKAMVAGENHA
jgi:PAS domain S-box-containing protein